MEALRGNRAMGFVSAISFVIVVVWMVMSNCNIIELCDIKVHERLP